MPLGEALGRVDVGVGVDPDQSDFLVLAAIELGDAGHRSRRHRVVAAQHQRNLAGFQRLQHQFGVLGAGGGDFFQILRVGSAFLLLFRDGDGNIAAVFDHVSQGFQARFQAGDAHRRRPHVDAAARLAKVERNADHADLLGSDAGGRGVGRMVVMKDFEYIW